MKENEEGIVNDLLYYLKISMCSPNYTCAVVLVHLALDCYCCWFKGSDSGRRGTFKSSVLLKDHSGMRQIAIVGAGAAGLCAARHVCSQSDMIPTVFEQSNVVGGLWNYTENIGRDHNGLKISSALYKNLVTNQTKEVMAFPDFPFEEKIPSFMTHEHVREYLVSYCDHFGLEQYIQFEIIVTHITPIKVDNKTKWEICVKNLKNKTFSTSHFDAVFICNGHFAKPNIPHIPGIERFKGNVIHSQCYRHPEDFTGEKVVILGAKSSGQDISLDIAKFAKSVIISHRTPIISCPLPENVSQARSVSEFKEDGKSVTFEDGKEAELESFIFCTGYRYDFPFLDPLCGLEVENGRVKYLYKHTINVSHPTMSIIGICAKISPTLLFHYQVLFTLTLWNSPLMIPCKEDMLKDIEDDYMARRKEGLPHRAAHFMSSRQWKYFDELADVAGVPRLPKYVANLYEHVDKNRKEMLCDFKKYSVALSGDEFVLKPL